ncbi:helix-turn-helix transcriptional regulator [Micromonospora tulbaghiae]|uniref:helix-turn-helix transcriptional regulator n=1 Tax=Micromonospora tulbaghiae TaxID=479978 RepID=UPI003420E018
MDHDVAARTLLLLTLLQTRPAWPAAELAERIGVSPRTLRRDLRRLAELGYEVVGRPGPGGHYRLAVGARVPPMVFDDDEVVALVVGLRMAEQGQAAEAAARALVKLRRVLPRRLAALATDVAAHSETVVLDRARPQDALLGPLTAAAAADLGVRFAYTDQHGTTSRRRVDSVRCLFVRGRWNVLAYDLDRTDWRVFRLDRIRDVVGDGATTRRDPPADDLATWLRTDFGRSATGRD